MSSRSVLEMHGVIPQEEQRHTEGQPVHSSKLPTIAANLKAMLVTRRRLRLSPDNKLFFLYEPGRQVSSAVRIKNTSGSPAAFKFQTTSPKSCFMRPPHGILAPGESIIATVVKFIEVPEGNEKKKTTEKFKIVSLKVNQGTQFTPELFEEHREFVAVERVLRVAFLDPQGQSPEIDKLKKRLAEAEAAQQAAKKTPEERAQTQTVATPVAVGGVLDEWKEQQKEKRAPRP